ncbi:DNA translocase FtsK [Caulifigura coniformis]|uniref:DNA translocase FtsK n=1 Tax=Caulifigura coniformis TaxID=2527983 RepID=A0A517SF87_9PLAN|nr:DNA translocase FtsK [Caulifigura coniformis]QDT54750.1 DNA translocase FtsK [Caulifigura coniformis]
MPDVQRLKSDLLALAILALTVFLGLSLISYSPADPPGDLVYPPPTTLHNLCGPAGARLTHQLHSTLGLGSWALLGGLILFDLRLFARKPVPDPFVRMMGGAAALAAICGALQLTFPRLGTGPAYGSGGFLGAAGQILMTDRLSTGGSAILLATLFIAGLLLATDVLLARLAYGVLCGPFLAIAWIFGWRRKAVTSEPAPAPAPVKPTVVKAATPEPVPAPRPVVEEPKPAKSQPAAASKRSLLGNLVAAVAPVPDTAPAVAAVPAGNFKVNPPAGLSKSSREAEFNTSSAAAKVKSEYQLPPIDLLGEGEAFPFDQLAAKAEKTRAIIEKTFQEFGLNVKVTEADTGPVVTQFELELEPGLRVSKVQALADDLAIALRVPSVRVVSPIPGKNTVGVEVPNDKRVMVRLREIMEAVGADGEKFRVPIYLGKDVSGRPLVVDMTKMPHLLIAGRTGTGKSVCLNTLILSMLLTRTPDEVKMLMIDPKMVELSPYTRIPHLMHPVITDMKKAEAVLAWAVDKMEERYELLSKVGVRHLDSYNKLGKEKVCERMGVDPDSYEAEAIPESMPYIVIIADEMADMIMTSGKDVEAHIIRLAQKSRAVGIHLVLATQKPTVDVITGLIKSNLPARISFQVASRTDSRVVLDECGAERLLGHGDMLYLAPGTSTLNRAQGTYVSDDEVNSVIDFFSAYPPEYSAEIEKAANAAKETESKSDGPRERDDMYDEAVEIVIREGRGSCSLLQRAMKVGYGRAARMIDHMAEDGIVGPYNGSKFREVVITPEQWEEMREELLAGA